jgi:hypothetical protein
MVVNVFFVVYEDFGVCAYLIGLEVDMKVLIR